MQNFRLRALTYVAAALIAATSAPLAAFEGLSFSVNSNDEALKTALREASLVASLQGDSAKTSREIVAASQADYARLLSVLYAKGYYSGVIEIAIDGQNAARIPTFSVPRNIQKVSIKIAPGQQFRLGRAQVAPLAPGTQLPDGFRRGAVAESQVLQDTVDAAVEGWRDVGHAKVSLKDQRIVADHRAKTLDADLQMAPGPQVRFGDLNVTGKTAVRIERVKRIAGLPTGEIYAPDDLEKVAKRLRRTGTFSSVALSEGKTLGPNNEMDINLALVDQKPRRFEFGAELSSTEGLSLTGAWLHRNLMGGAERLRISGEVAGIAGETGGIDYSIDTRLEIPAAFGTDTTAFFTGEIAYEDEPTYTSSLIGFGAGWSKIFSDSFEAEVGVGLRYSETDDSLGNRSFLLLTLPASFTWDRRDAPLAATQGYYVYGDATPFVDLDSGATGLRLNADLRAYRGFGGDDNVVLAGRFQMGTVVSSAGSAVPPDFLYYSGGGGTVRGQGYQSLGITSGGVTTGGESFLGGSAEMRVAVTDKIGVVGFVDAGLIGDDSFFGGGDWHAGAGLGVRYQTGVGPIRLDLAVPVAGTTGSGLQFYIGIGEAF